MKTKAELARAVIRKGGWCSAEETPSAADAAFVISEYEAKLPEWTDLGIVYWAVSDDVPDVVFPTVVDLMLNEVMNTFGTEQSIEDRAAREQLLLKKLRRHAARGASGVPTRAVYY